MQALVWGSVSSVRVIPASCAAGFVSLLVAGSVSASISADIPDLPGIAAQATRQAPANDAYERGQEYIRAGDPEAALALWVALQDSLWAAGAEDPRIGVAFLQTVAEHDFDQYREVATQVFLWAFSGRTAVGEEARGEILAEGRRTFALTDSLYADYRLRAGERDPTVLARAIKEFWINRDPTPTTVLNERLLEHWDRIVHARRNYIYNYSSPYRTDDRGTFYVKYGEPDRIAAGNLSISSFDLRQRGVAVEDIVSVDMAPRYEIWRYANLEPPAFTYFLFGNEDQTGPFRYVRGLGEIMAPNARVVRINGLRAQYFLEYFYYVELGKMGGPYGDRLGDLDRLWGESRAPQEGYLEALSVRFDQEDAREAQRAKRPAHSEFDDSRKSALSAQLARTLDGADPRLLVLSVSSPRWKPVVEENDLRREIVLAPFESSQTVIARDQDLNEVGRVTMAPVDARGEISTVELRHAAGVGHVTVATEHVVEGETVADANDIGVLPGHRHFAVPPPLRRDAVQLEVSDMIVGIPPQSVDGLDGLPVPLLPATQFWRDDPVRVYFEIYHPSGRADGEASNFDVRVLVVPFTGPLSAEQLARPEAGGRAAVTLSLESEAPTGRHYFDLDLRSESPGLQQLVVEVTDPGTGVSRTRAVAITLLLN